MSNEDVQTHEEVKKTRELFEKGFGRAIKGFRTMGDAADFNNRWKRLDADLIRLMYPKRTAGMNDLYVLAVRQEVSDRIKKKGIQGLRDTLGGSLDGLQHILRTGVSSVDGVFKKGGLTGPAVKLAGEIVLDIFIFGTTSTGVPDFETFVVHRQKKVFGYSGRPDPETKGLWDHILGR